MKEIYKTTTIFLIFFIVFLFKESIYEVIIKVNNLDKLDKSIIKIKESYYEEEYKTLLKTINVIDENEFSYVYSKVLYRDIYNYFDEITILKGYNDNIKNNSAVINENGLIGTINKVNKNSSVVNLITNKNSQISIKVNNVYGILKSENNDLIITGINNYENVHIGDIVFTSGIGSLPENIKVGTISNIKKDKLGLEQKIIVSSDVDFDNVKYIAILCGEELWFGYF